MSLSGPAEINQEPSPLESYREQIRIQRIEKIFRETVLSRNIGREDFLEQPTFHRGSRWGSGSRRLQLWSFFAASVDALMMVGLSCLFFAAALVVNQMALNFEPSKSLHFVWIAVAVCFSYMIVLRSFVGCSLGEWSCGLRLGTVQDRKSAKYILRVCLRSATVIFTGLIVIPALSFVTGVDWAGRLSGLPLTHVKDSKD